MCLWCGWVRLDEQDLDSECGRYIDIKVISAAENSNKFPKNQVLEGNIS
jgi:hypothetical protein